jgi:hypothetical protein
MEMYPGLNCSDCPSLKELSMAKIDARIHEIQDIGVNPKPRVGPIPLDQGPPARGKWKWGNPDSLVSPTHHSSSASRCGFLMGRGYGW